MNDAVSKLFVQFVPIVLGIVGTWITLSTFYNKRHQEMLDRYAENKQKAYAAERDFEHLRRNQEQMKESIRLIDDEVTETRADLKEMKGMLTVLFGKLSDSVSGIFGFKERKQ